MEIVRPQDIAPAPGRATLVPSEMAKILSAVAVIIGALLVFAALHGTYADLATARLLSTAHSPVRR